MHWGRALAAWLAIIVLESASGTVRQLFVAPAIGDLVARQLGVVVGSLLVLGVAAISVRWIGARGLVGQLKLGASWAALIVVFEIGLGFALGYPARRVFSDYDPSEGGWMAFGLVFTLFAPVLAARLRGAHADFGGTRPRDLALAYVRAFCAGELHVLESLLAPGLRFSGPVLQVSSRAEYLRGLAADPPQPAGYAIDDVVEGPDAVALFWEYREREEPLRLAQLFRVEDGRIAEIRLVFDSRTLADRSG